jgi:ABC-type transporter MlaC component
VRSRGCLLLVASVLTSLADPSGAQDSTASEAREIQVVRGLEAQVRRLAQQTVDPRDALSKVIDRYFDVPGMAERVAGSALTQADSSERAAFADAYRFYLAELSVRSLTMDPHARLEAVGVRALANGRVRVVTRVTSGSGERRDLDWILRQGEPPLIEDVLVDGVRLTSLQRAEFGEILEHEGGGLGALTHALRKVAQTSPP